MIKDKEWAPEFDIGRIYTLKNDIWREDKILAKGTPLKIISKHQFGKFIICENYRGKEYYISPEHLDNKEIKKYPKSFLIAKKKTTNLFCKVNLEDSHISIIIFGIIMIITGVCTPFISIPYNFLFCFILLIIGIFFLMDWNFFFDYDPLFSKEHLKELKILLQRSDRQAER